MQSEALICSWADEAGDPAAIAIVMGDAAEGFHRSEEIFAASGSQYVSVPLLDGAFVACRGDSEQSCHWNVLDGSDWISLLIVGLQPDEVDSLDAVTSGQSPVVTSVAQAAAQLDIPRTPSGTPTIDCSAKLTPAAIGPILGVDPSRVAVLPSPPLEQSSLENSSPETGQVMWKYAYELLGYSSCGVTVDGSLIGAVTVATDSAWVLQDPDAQQPVPRPIDGHGNGVISKTRIDSQTWSSSAAFASGDDLLLDQFFLPAGLDGESIVVSILELLTA